MKKMTRRAMLWATSAGVATLSGVTAVVLGTQHEKKAEAAASTVTGSMVVYIPDAAKGEIHIMLGDQEYVSQNPDLIRQLLNIAH